MKIPFKKSSQQIEKEIYSILNIEKKSIFELDVSLYNISKHYHEFQKSFLDLLEKNVKLSYLQDNYYKENILIVNNLVYIHQDDSIKFRYLNNNLISHIGIKFHGPTLFTNSNYSLLPNNIDFINFFGDKFISEHRYTIEEPIKRYFVEHLMLLEETYKQEIQESLLFLRNLRKIFYILESHKLNLNDYVFQEVKYHMSTIYDIFNSNNDFFNIACDINIEKELERMNETKKNKKIKNKNESFI